MTNANDALSYLDSVNYKDYVIGFSSAVYVFEQYLNLRQHRRYLMRERPKELADIVGKADFGKSQRYNLEKSRFAFFENAFKQVGAILFLYYNVLPYIWNLSGNLLLHYTGYGNEYEILHSIVFIIIYSLYSIVSSLPFSLYSTFVIEERHGFNKQTMGLFFIDLLKTQLISVVIILPFISAFLWVIKSTGNQFYLYVWAIAVAFQLFFMTIYPTVIQPLFNKLAPLVGGELRTRIEELASRIEFPLKKLYVIDGSKRSSHSNAYFYGFGSNKHIVLFDTLIDHSTVDEICAALAHELGHWAMSHTLRILIVKQVYMLIMFWLFSYFINNPQLYYDFGFSTMPTLIGFLLFQYVDTPIDSVINLLMHVYQRKNEYEADAYAHKLGYASTLRSVLIKLSVKNLGGFNTDPWHSAWNRSHPSLTERLDALGIEPTSDKPISAPEESKKEQ